MPPSFGNAVVCAANQQSICNLSNQDIVTPYTEWVPINNVPREKQPKWKVKWKTVHSTLLRTIAVAVNSRTTPPDSSAPLSQVSARPTANWRESEDNMQNPATPSQNPFLQRAEVCTSYAGHLASVVQIGPCHGGTNSINITNQPGPQWHSGYMPPGAFYDDGAPPPVHRQCHPHRGLGRP